VFYPADLPQDRELEFASRALPTIEINGSFYSLQSPASYARWHDATPGDFVFAVKGARYITHMRRLKDVEAPLANFLASGLFNLRRKLGPMLWQFPPNFHYDEERMARFFELLPRDTGQALALARKREPRMKGRSRLAVDRVRPLRHAVEIRHESFADESFIALLRRHGVALVVADTAGKMAVPGGRDRRLRLSPAARRQENLRERLHRPRARALGGAHPRVVPRRGAIGCEAGIERAAGHAAIARRLLLFR
jgi:uncharacterized protein YecE (DUF72 family)